MDGQVRRLKPCEVQCLVDSEPPATEPLTQQLLEEPEVGCLAKQDRLAWRCRVAEPGAAFRVGDPHRLLHLLQAEPVVGREEQVISRSRRALDLEGANMLGG